MNTDTTRLNDMLQVLNDGKDSSEDASLEVKRAALEQLLAASGRENHSEVQWLEQDIRSATVKEDQ